ncbi:MAG: secretin N-terminal domain-containing protein [Planctomycetota bacterium]
MAICLLAAPAAADPEPGRAVGAAAPEPAIRLSFPPNVPMSVLIDYVAQRLTLNIIYDDQVARATVTLQSPAPVEADALLPLLETILRTRGFALVDLAQPGWKRVVTLQSLAQVAELQRMGDETDANVVTRIFELEHMTPTELEPLIRPLLTTPGAQLLVDTQRRGLVVTDFVEVVERAAAMIDAMDVPGVAVTRRFLNARHVSASVLAQELLRLLAAERSPVGRGEAEAVRVIPQERTNRVLLIGSEAAVNEAASLAAQIDVDLDLRTRVFAMRFADPQRLDTLAKRLIDPLAVDRLYRATIDEEASLLVVTATDAILAQVADLANELDQPIIEASSPIRFYKLQNANAGEVLATIRSIESTAGASALAGFAMEEGSTLPASPVASDASLEPSEPDRGPIGLWGGGSPVAVQGQEVTIAADENTNTLIVIGDPAAQRIYASLIERLDKRRPQVLIEATIVTVDTADDASLGVEVSVGDFVGDNQTFAFSQFGLSSVGDEGGLDLIPGVGFNGAVLDADVADVVIRALKTDTRATVVAAPKILVNDNASGVIASVAEAPVTSINQGQNSDTVTFSQFVSAGTTITVTPRIAEGDYLRLAFDVSLESFAGEGSAGVPPPRQSNQITSEVTIPDGATVVVGGINQQNVSESVSRIPILGELPLLEYVFSSRSETRSNATLFVFLRPVILRDDRFEDLRYWSGQDLRAAGELGAAGLPVDPDGFPTSATMTIR